MKKYGYGLFKMLIDLSKQRITSLSNYHMEQYSIRSYSAIHKNANWLEKNGFVRSNANKACGRKRSITLTQKGKSEAAILKKSRLIRLWLENRLA